MLDALNDDCRRLVLSYVPVRDIMRAERVSRSWQQEVLKYLRSVRIKIEPTMFSGYHNEKTRGSSCRIVPLKPDAEWFDQVITKLGSSIVASYCFSEYTLLTLLHNCPNLEHLHGDMYYFQGSIGLVENALSFSEEVYNIKKLKQITFKYFKDMDDDYVDKFIANDLEEFTIISNKEVTGRCLLSLPLNLKSLTLVYCHGLELQQLLPAVKKLPRLRKLELTELAPEIFQNAHLLLDEVPNVEELTLHFSRKIKLKDDIAQSISRLSHLKRLDLIENHNVTDEWLVAIGRGCRHLQELYLACCSGVSAGAVVALCKAVGSTLTTLNQSIRSMTDEHVLDIIGSCPNLESLCVADCRLSANFTAAAIQLCAARAPTLHLSGVKQRNDVNYIEPGTKRVYPGLTIVYDVINSDDSSDEDVRLMSSDSDRE